MNEEGLMALLRQMFGRPTRQSTMGTMSPEQMQQFMDQSALDQAVYSSGNTPMQTSAPTMGQVQPAQMPQPNPIVYGRGAKGREAYRNALESWHGGLLNETPEGNRAYRQMNDYRQELMMRLRDPSLDPETRKQLLQALSGLQ